MCRRTPVPIYSGSALFRWLDKQFNVCSTRCVGSVSRHPPHAGTDIQLWSSAGRASCSVGRYELSASSAAAETEVVGYVSAYALRASADKSLTQPANDATGR
jgi:hypothetical protein